MIGKIPPGRRDGLSSFFDLTEYITDAQKTSGAIWSINLDGEDPSLWSAMMQGTATLNGRVGDPAMHFVLSWPETEKPTGDQARAAGLMALQQLGAEVGPGGHQAVVALHQDTGNWHVHVCLNRVHPISNRALHPADGWTHNGLAEACRRIEFHQGWSEDRGTMMLARDDRNQPILTRSGDPIVIPSPYRNPKSVPGTANKMESATGEASWLRYVKEIAGPYVRDAIATGDWQTVHRVAAGYGVRIERSGGGLAFACASGIEVGIKASSVGSWAKASAMTKRLGEFVPADPVAAQEWKAHSVYDPAGEDGVHHVEDQTNVRTAIAAHVQDFEYAGPVPGYSLRSLSERRLASDSDSRRSQVLLSVDDGDHRRSTLSLRRIADPRADAGAGDGIRSVAEFDSDASASGGGVRGSVRGRKADPLTHAERLAAARARSPGRKRYSEEGKRENETAKVQRTQERRDLYAAYREWRASELDGLGEVRRDAMRDLRQRQARERRGEVASFREHRNHTWSQWKAQDPGERIDAAVLRASLALQAAQRMEVLRLAQARERAEEAAHWAERRAKLPSWRAYLRTTADDLASPHHGAAERVLKGMRYRGGGEDQGEQEPAIGAGSRQPQVQVKDIPAADLAALEIRIDRDSDGVYYRDTSRDLDIGEDLGNRIEVWDTSDRALRQLIAVAAQKFGGVIELTGDDDFKTRAAEIAARMGVRVSNPDLQHTWQAARDEQRQQGRGRRGKEAPAQAPQSSAPSTPPSGAPDSAAPAPADPAPAKAKAERKGRGGLDRDEILRIREGCDLVQLAASHGYKVDREKTGSVATAKWVTMRRGDDVLLVHRQSTGDTWADQGDGSHGDAIQFQRRETGVPFLDAARAVAAFNGSPVVADLPEVPRGHTAQRERYDRGRDPAAMRRTFFGASGDLATSTYLQERGLLPANMGKDCRLTTSGAVLAAHRTPDGQMVGFESLGRDGAGAKFHKFSRGGERTGFYMVGEMETPRAIIVTESAIDAASAARFGREPALYLSTGGSLSGEQLVALGQLADRYPVARVLIGTDVDEKGDLFAAKIKEAVPRAEDARESLRRAGVKDWNDLLKLRLGLLPAAPVPETQPEASAPATPPPPLAAVQPEEPEGEPVQDQEPPLEASAEPEPEDEPEEGPGQGMGMGGMGM
jgi:hypothetical protein